MFFNKRILKLIFAIFLIVFIGWAIYKRYNSVENSTERLSRSEIADWFYGSKSLTHSKPDTLRSETDKNRAISLRRIVDRLSEDWEFEFEDWDLLKAEDDSFLINYNYVFRNEETNQLKFFWSKYYYDLDEVNPIPLKKEVILKNGDNYETIKVDKLWEGDFDVYCVKAD